MRNEAKTQPDKYSRPDHQSTGNVALRTTREQKYAAMLRTLQITCIFRSIVYARKCGGLEMTPHVNKWTLVDCAHK